MVTVPESVLAQTFGASFAAVKAGLLAMLPAQVNTLTLRLDSAGRLQVRLAALQQGAYRWLWKDEAWLTAAGVDVFGLKAGVYEVVQALGAR